MDLEYDEMRAVNVTDEIRAACGIDLTINWSGRKRMWLAGLNTADAMPVEFDSVDEAISWAYWYAGAQ